MAKGRYDEDESSELKEFFSSVGARIRELRVERKLTQKELAALSEVRAPYLNEIELLGANVSLKLLYQIAQGLNVIPQDLFPAGKKDEIEASSSVKLTLVRKKASEAADALTGLLKIVDEPVSKSESEARPVQRPK